MSEHETASQPTNRELAEEIKKLSDELGIETPTAGLNKASLLDALEALRRTQEARQGAPMAPATGVVRATSEAISPPLEESGDEASHSLEEEPGIVVRRDPIAEAIERDLMAVEDDRVREVIRPMLEHGRDFLMVGFDAGPLIDPARAAAEAFILEVIEITAPTHPAIAHALQARLGSTESAAKKGLGAYKVARGKSVTTRRGIRGPGETVMASDFHSCEQLEKLRIAGVLVRS